jgi:hypothetical protein
MHRIWCMLAWGHGQGSAPPSARRGSQTVTRLSTLYCTTRAAKARRAQHAAAARRASCDGHTRGGRAAPGSLSRRSRSPSTAAGAAACRVAHAHLVLHLHLHHLHHLRLHHLLRLHHPHHLRPLVLRACAASSAQQAPRWHAPPQTRQHTQRTHAAAPRAHSTRPPTRCTAARRAARRRPQPPHRPPRQTSARRTSTRGAFRRSLRAGRVPTSTQRARGAAGRRAREAELAPRAALSLSSR